MHSVINPYRPPAETTQKGFLGCLMSRLIASKLWPRTLCLHRHITVPMNNAQRCLDCGSVRAYFFDAPIDGNADGVRIGAWYRETFRRTSAHKSLAYSAENSLRYRPAKRGVPQASDRAVSEKLIKKMCRRASALILIAAAAHTCGAQVPDAPKPRIFDKADWALLSADIGARALDTVSTRLILTDSCKCNRELILPSAIVDHTPTLAAFEGGVVGVNYLTARALAKHHHGRLAKTLLTIDSAAVTPFAIHNLFLSGPQKISIPIFGVRP